MLNVMEERDIQIRGYVLRLPLDVLVVASANPEDYTNRGRIITPLKDRFGAEIRTHYPTELEAEVAVIRQEAHLVAEVPDYLVEILARFTRNLRESSSVDQRSGVSARFAIAGAETIAAAALHRATRPGRGRGRGPGRRPRDRRRRTRRQDRVRDRRGGPRAARSSPTCCAPRPPRPSAPTSAGSTSRCWSRRSRTARWSPPASRSPPATSSPGCRCSASRSSTTTCATASTPANDGERAGAIELALEGLYLARKIGKDTDGAETVYGYRSLADRTRSPPVRRRRPARAAGRHRRGAGRDRRGRDGGLQPRAGDAGVPAPRRRRPDRPRRPGPAGGRAAPRPAAAAQPRRHARGGPRAARPGGARGAQAAGPRRDDGRRRPGVPRDAAREPPDVHRGCGERAERLRLDLAARRARTTSGSRTCSAASCSTSGSPA